jgi:hypothetical protein
MSRVGRLAGALLAETAGAYYLVGNLKRPCDWAAAGFARPPGEIDALARPFVRLETAGPVNVAGPWLSLAVEGEALPRLLAERLLIERNGSVSDRLWRLVLLPDPDADDLPPDALLDARWLGEIPPQVWRVVRDTVLKCT